VTLKIVAAVVAVVVASLFYAPVRSSALVLVGRHSGCTVERAWQIDQKLKHQTEVKDRILAASKVIETDAATGLENWQTPYGNFWIPKRNNYALPFNLAEQELKIYGSGKMEIKPGDVVLDCGANIGVYTREALKLGARLVVAIEPAPENVVALQRTFKDEIAAGKVIVYPKGVWDKDDVLALHIHPDNSAADSFLINKGKSGEAEVKVPLTTIDKMVAELKLDKVDYIKMDIEGAEVKALVGARETIAKHHPRLSLSVYHDETHPYEVPKAVRAAWNGYTQEVGPCMYANYSIRPDILYFY